MAETVEYAQHGAVAEITINRSEALNALNGDVLLGISRHLKTIRTSPDLHKTIRALVFKGSGDRAFVAGADIKLMHNAAADPAKRADLTSFIELGQQVMRQIEDLPLPVIAEIQGFAIGGGLELALACDLIVASEQAKLGQAEVNLGLIPGFGGTQRLIRRVGAGGAKRLILTGDPISGAEAYRIGLVDWLVSPAELSGTTAKICSSLAEKSPVAVAASKRLVDAGWMQSRNQLLQAEIDGFLQIFETSDAREGIAAFIEKRKPVFPGR